MKHGGRRRGSGRPVTIGATIAVNTRLDRQTVSRIDWLANFEGVSKAEVIRRAIKNEYKNFKPVMCGGCGRLMRNETCLKIHLGPWYSKCGRKLRRRKAKRNV